MTINLPIQFSQLVDLIDQLTPEEHAALLTHLISRDIEQAELSPEERIQLLDAAKIHTDIQVVPSVRRVDWYDDDGR